MKTSKKEKYRRKVRELLEDDGIDYERELNKSNKLEKGLRKDKELLCIECGELNRKSVPVEVRYDA